MGAVEQLQLWVRRLFWPDAVQIQPQPLRATSLAQVAGQWLFNSIQVHPATSFDEAVMSAEMATALETMLRDYRAAKPQSIQEREVGRVLDHVARTYLRA